MLPSCLEGVWLTGDQWAVNAVMHDGCIVSTIQLYAGMATVRAIDERCYSWFPVSLEMISSKDDIWCRPIAMMLSVVLSSETDYNWDAPGSGVILPGNTNNPRVYPAREGDRWDSRDFPGFPGRWEPCINSRCTGLTQTVLPGWMRFHMYLGKQTIYCLIVPAVLQAFSPITRQPKHLETSLNDVLMAETFA